MKLELTLNTDRMSPFERFKNQRIFGSLNGLRFIAIVVVLWHHIAASSFVSQIAHRGYEGVTLFFAISGFLITTLLLREKVRTGTVDMRKFYIRRTLRIFPLYYSVLALYFVMIYFTGSPERQANFFGNLPGFLTYTSNFFTVEAVTGTTFAFAWSLATEEQFYMIWPWVEKYVSSAKAVLSMIVILGIIWFVRANGLGTDSVGGIIMFHVMPAICFGVIVAHLLDNENTFNLLYHMVGGKYASLILSVGTIMYLSISNINYILVHFLMAMIVTSCVIREDHILAKFLQNPLFIVGGTISYGMYLLHMLTLHVVEAIAHKVGIDSVVLIFIGTVMGTMVAAYFSYHYYESYFLKLKTRFEVKAPAQPTPVIVTQ